MYGLMASGEKQDWADPQEPLIDSEKVGFKLLNQFPQTPFIALKVFVLGSLKMPIYVNRANLNFKIFLSKQPDVVL